MMMQSTLPSPTRASLRLVSLLKENRWLVAGIIILSGLFLSIASVLIGHYRQSLNDNYDRFGALIANTIATESVGVMLQANQTPTTTRENFTVVVNSLLSGSTDLVGIAFQDPDGRTLFEQDVDQSQTKRRYWRTYIARIEHACNNAPKTFLGTVQIQLSGQTIETIMASTQLLVMVLFISAWLVSILAIGANTMVLHKQLNRLVQGVKRLSSGDFGYKIAHGDLWGDMKTLAQAFNNMSLRLRAYEDQNLDAITYERNKLQAVLLSMADGLIVCGRDGELMMLNDAACSHLGVESSAALLRTNMRAYKTLEGERCFEPVINDFESWIADHPDSAEIFTRQVEMPTITLKVLIALIEDPNGEDLGFVISTRDITREAEVDRLKTNFISNVSHELRTPVTTIKSYVDTLYNHADELDEETKQEFMHTLQVETDRLKKMVNDILDFTKLEETHQSLAMEWQDMTPILQLTVQSFKVLAQQKNLMVSTAIESNLPEVFINSDTIERVMRNLLSNAIKYTNEGGRIKVRAELSEQGDAVIVSVDDTGIGIEEAHLSQIFDRFYRVENKVHTIKGTGLGLHLVKIAIEKHHKGEVFVKSKAGVGSSFGFRLYLHQDGLANPGAIAPNTDNRVSVPIQPLLT